MNDSIAINQRTALKMFWDAGFDNDTLLVMANESLKLLKQPAIGYFYADDVSKQIEKSTLLISRIPS